MGHINNLGTGNLEWGGNEKGLRKGRSVYKQPGTRVDGSCHSKKGSKLVKGTKWGAKGDLQGGQKGQGECAIYVC